MREPKPDPPRRIRRLHWHLGFWSLTLIALFVLFLVLASMSLTGRVVALPGWVGERVTTRMNAELSAGSVSLERVELGVTRQGRPRLRLVGVGIRDGSGLQVAQLNAVEAGVKPVPLLRGQLEPSGLSLTGAQVTLRRKANGEFDLSFGQAGGASGDLAAVLDAIDRAFTDGPLSRAEQLEANGLTITLEDARSGRLWQVTDGRMHIEQTETVVDITVAFDVFNQTEALAETVLGFRSAKGSSEASFGATFKNATAADIAAQSPVLAFLRVVDAPISGALRTTIDADGNVSDLAGTLELGPGALSPTRGARPVRFERAKVYVDYDPVQDRIDFSEVSVVSELGEARGEGRAYLRDYNNGWPGGLVGQFSLNQAQVNPFRMFPEPLSITGGAADFRLRLDPFTVELGQVMLRQGGNRYTGAGVIAASRDGWSLAIDAGTEQLSRDQAMALWPLNAAPNPRNWVSEFVTAGEVSDLRAAFRLAPGQPPRISVGAGLRGVTARVVKAMAPIEGGAGYLSIENQSFTAVAEAGTVTAPNGDKLNVAGSTFRIPFMPDRPTPAVVDLRVSGPLAGALSLLDAKPYEVFKYGTLGPDLATGQVSAEGRLDLRLRPEMQPGDVKFDVTADLTDVRSEVLIPDRVFSADRARVRATDAAIEVTGDARIGQVAVSGTWRQAMGPENRGISRVVGEVELSQVFLDEFNIGLPANTLNGQGTGQVEIDLAPDHPPAFTLVSDLSGVGISVPDLGWSKAQSRTGRMEVAGSLGDVPRIDRLEFEAPGLSATGQVRVNADGSLDAATFDRVRLGGWLDAPVTFQGRGLNQPVGITVSGGSADLRRAEFSSGSGNGSSGPIRLVLDRLTISEGIVLTGFTGDFNRRGGLNGTFNALVDGGAAIRGTLAPQPEGSAFRITSADAGGVLRGAGVFQTARGGDLELILAPRRGEGIYEGDLKISDVRVVGAPALAELLSVVSVVGLLEQLGGEGIAFSDVDARFRLTPEQVTLYRSSAIGASLGLSMDGYYDLGSSEMDMRGVVSPLYLVNAIGQLFTRKGEGLVGFTFNLKGSPGDPQVAVHPLSVLTPGMFRDIFRRSPPQPDE